VSSRPSASRASGQRRKRNLNSTASLPQAAVWLSEHGPKELELLFRAVVYQTAAPVLVADAVGQCQEASAGASKLLRLPREKIIGRSLDEFTEPASKARAAQLFRALQVYGEQEGALGIALPDAGPQDVKYTAKGNVLPVRHVLVLREKTELAEAGVTAINEAPTFVHDYALYLLDSELCVAAWYAGAERIYGYKSAEVIGKHISLLYPAEDNARGKLQEQFNRAATEGHAGTEDWQLKKDGSRFWANALTMGLKDESGVLQGFARVSRDFSGRHERDEKQRSGNGRVRPLQMESTIAGIVSHGFDGIREANEAFLQLAGYSREDLHAGRLHWPDLTPPEYLAVDEFAHEEGLRFGACTPFEKELIRKDGTRVPVLVVTALLKLAPCRWITFVQDLRERNRLENIDEEVVGINRNFEEIVGDSAPMRRVLGQVEVVAPTDATVLILGETGTGKELIARAVHRMSPRRSLPFITLNCAAIPTGLLESELFGYERGAFTGALSQKIGRFEMAHRGTLFLDEVGDIPLELQPKLLRALQEKAFERLGGTRTIPIDVRLVAATNRNLTQMMGDKLFRSDLYYRLKVFPITAPPLRDHPEDIPVLARHFTKKYATKMERHIDKIPAETMRALSEWRWPGNVRELENFIERAVILSRGPSLRAPLAEIREDAQEGTGSATLEQVEREYIVRVLRESAGVVTTAATRLGLHRTTLNAMMRKLGISRKDL
jgi:formate hydrogenlyase transcriptional activator